MTDLNDTSILDDQTPEVSDTSGVGYSNEPIKTKGWSDIIDHGLDKFFNWNTQKISVNPDETKESFGPDIYNSIETGAELDAQKLQAIQRINSKGFQIIELNPRLMDPLDYSCELPIDELIETIGAQTDFFGFDTISVNPSPLFKSYEIPIVGNYIRIEFCPAKFASSLVPHNNNQNVAGASHTINAGSMAGLDNNYAFLNFGDVQGKSIKVKHGDEFKTYFNNVIITFPGLGPKIRIIVGFNAEYATKDHHSESLHLGNVASISNNHHALTWNAFSVSNCSNSASPTQFLVNANNILNFKLIDINQNNAKYAFGHIWLTGLWFSGLFNNATADDLIFKFDLILQSSQAFGTHFTGGPKKCFFSLDRFLLANTSKSIYEQYFAFQVPIRVTLSAFDTLNLRLSLAQAFSGGAATVLPAFSIHGYSYGPMTERNGASDFPKSMTFQLDQNAYPFDLAQGTE